MRSFADPDTHFEIVPSTTPPSVDGLAIDEPKFLQCCSCGAKVRIDEGNRHRTAIDNLPHDRDCPQRDVVSRYYEELFLAE